MTKHYLDYKYIPLAVFGAMMNLYGNFQNYPQMYYTFGSLCMLIAALHYKLVYFIALEIILSAGHAAILLSVGPYTQFALPILLCLQLLIFYLMAGKENSIFLIIGIIGIAMLSVGLAYDNQWIFFWGSSFVAIYAYYSVVKRRYAASVWAILNTLFAAIALYKIIMN